MELERREFLKLIGVSAAAATLGGCSQQQPRELIPYVIPDEEIIPGRSVWYATVCHECPARCGMQVRVREGRATKAEGNPRHPVNRGALCARGQASLQGLYNPDRVQRPMRKNSAGAWEPLSWDQAEAYLSQELKKVMGSGRGKEVAWMSGYVTGTIDELVDRWLKLFGSERRLRYEALSAEPIVDASRSAFGLAAVPWLAFERADVVLSFGADFLETFLSPVGFMMDFAARRGDVPVRNFMAYAGPRLSLTAANADTWLPVQTDRLSDVALSLAYIMAQEEKGVSLPASVRSAVEPFAPAVVAERSGLSAETLTSLARRFGAAKGKGIAVTGYPHCSGPMGLTLASATLLLNVLGGNIGQTVLYGRSHAIGGLSPHRDVMQFIGDMRDGKIAVLFVSDANPVFSLPEASGFVEAMSRVPLVVSFATMMDETTSRATLVLPVHHPLESWGDDATYTGVRALMQPVMQPLFPTRHPGDILLGLARRQDGKGFGADNFETYLRQRWGAAAGHAPESPSFASYWRGALEQGGVWKQEPGEPTLRVRESFADGLKPAAVTTSAEMPVRLTIYPSAAFYDGRGANKPWLQELPDPMVKNAWGNWVEIHPEDARSLGIVDGDAVAVRSSEGAIELPAVVLPGLRRGEVAIPLGQGHTAYGRFAVGKGPNPAALVAPPATGTVQWAAIPVSIQKLGKRLPVVPMQEARTEHGREIIRHEGAASAHKEEEIEEEAHRYSLYPEPEHKEHRWVMGIDLDKCTGCSSCVTACYAENNVPVVGPREAGRGRDLAWLRIDRYYRRQEENVHAEFMPMLCQHCQRAPCEPVCPVYAAYHNAEGLNGQVYNRCIGTRYCANNCPYKVRRFNWFSYEWPEPLNWQLNPEVTVRSTGVMEKCTFCIQRIMEAKQNARLGNRPIHDGEVMTACQQTCPARAITFGDLLDSNSVVVRQFRESPRGYKVLAELNTVPSITYLEVRTVKATPETTS